MSRRLSLLIIALAAAPMNPIHAGETADPQAPVTTDASAADELPGFRSPRPGLFTGGQPDAGAWGDIAARGVTTVINLRPADELPDRDEAAEVAEAGLDYRVLPVAGMEGIDADAARTLWREIESAPGPVLVHCASGNRVGALLAIGAVREGGMTAEEGIAFGRAAGLGSAERRVREVLGLPSAEPPTP